MKTLTKTIVVMCIGLAVFLASPVKSAQAETYCCFNPLFLPFAAAGAVLGTAAAIVSAPFYPYPVYGGPGYYAPGPAYYGPGPRPYYHRRAWGYDHARPHYGYGPRPYGYYRRY